MKTIPISIKTKIAFGFFSITLLTIVLGLFSIDILKKETTLVEKMFTDSYQVSSAVKNIHKEVVNINKSLYRLAIDKDKKIAAEERANIAKSDSVIMSEFKLLRQRYQGPKQDIIETYRLYKESLIDRENFFKLLLKGDILSLDALMAQSETQFMEKLHEKIEILNSYVDTKAQEYYMLARENEKDAISSLILFLIFLSLLSVAIAIRAMYSLSIPLESLLSISKNISKGVLELPNDKKIRNIQSRSDEFGELFHTYYDTMHQIMSPYRYIIKSNRNLVEMTAEVGRLLESFDTYIIASKTNVSGEMTYVSEAFVTISGFSKEELLGKPQSLMCHPDMPKTLCEELLQTIQNKESWHGEIKNQKKDGGFYWIFAHISPDIDRDGNIIGYNAIHEDITQRKAFEELTSTLENRIHQEVVKNDKKTKHMLEQSRLALMGEMINMIAHQWRQPLSSISVISGTLLLDIELENYNEKSFKESLESINKLTQHLSETIEDFRGFFRENKEELVSDIRTIVENSISIIIYGLSNKNIQLEVHYRDNPKVQTHLNEIKQVILNLIKNAEDILMEKRVKNAKISLTVYNDAENVSIDVEDNGGGVPEEVSEKVFDPYFSTKKAKEGTGLGLYMSKTIVEEHCGGKLVFENKKDGACFSIKIPRYVSETFI